MSNLTHGALCNGIAGFALAAQRAGIHTIWTSDTDPFCNAVSRKHFPNAHQYGNIYDVHHPNRPDIISAGYPCQPESYAGKRQGAEDDRWLWPEVLRLIAECRPGWFIGENVAGHVTLGLAGVLADLEAAGYEVWPLVLPACALGAPHQRDRVWIIAHTHNRQPEQPQQALRAGWHPAGPGGEAAAHPNSSGCEEQHLARLAAGTGLAAWCADAVATHANGSGWGANVGNIRSWQPNTTGRTHRHAPSLPSNGKPSATRSGQEPEGQIGATGVWPDWRLTEPSLCAPDDGLPVGLVRPDTGGDTAGAQRAKADEKTWRRSTLHAAGNALVPQIPELFFQFIADYEAGLIPATL